MIFKIKIKTLILTIGLVNSCAIFGGGTEGVFFNTGLYYMQKDYQSRAFYSSNSFSSHESAINTSFGYGLGSGLLLGLKYYQEDLKTFDNGGGTLARETTKALGFGAGFMSQGLYAFLSLYPLQAPEKTSKVSQTTYWGGSGKGLDVAYLTDLGGVLVGPQVSLMIFDYKRLKSNQQNTNLETFSLTETILRPFLSLMIFL